MACNYHVSYKENIENLEDICELFDVDNSDLMTKFFAGVMGIIVLVFMFIYGNPGGGTVPGLLFFFVKYLLSWAALAVAAIFVNRTVWRKALKATAAGDAEEMYKRRKEKNGKELTSQIDFYENRFESVTKIKTRGFEYGQVVKLLETERAFGMVVKTDKNVKGSVRAMVGFPKEALADADIEDLKSFLLERCPRAKKRIKKF